MRENTESDLLPWILTGVAVIAGIGVVVGSINKDDLGLRSPAIRSAVESVAPYPTLARPARVMSAAIPLAATPRRIWECTVNDQKIFADAPCGIGATIREVSPVNGMNPTPAASSTSYYTSRPDTDYAPTDEFSYANESANHAGTCEALDAEVKSINARMRHGYTNPEGEYYRDRLRQIRDRKYDFHCDR